MKQCTHCRGWKPFECFSGHKYTTDGLQSWCKRCTVGAGQRYREANRVQINAHRREERAARRLVH